jgi:hypothetical protein
LRLRAIALALRARLRGFRRFATFLDRAATPPSKGGKFARRMRLYGKAALTDVFTKQLGLADLFFYYFTGTRS